MIILYNKNKVSGFDRNDLVLQNVSKCEVTWEKNGQFQIDLIYMITPEDTIWKSIVKGAIIKCPVAHQPDQLFRLNTPTKKMDHNGTYIYIEVIGIHITYDLSYNFLEDVRPVGMIGIDAGNYILNNTQYSHDFKWTGDIQDINTAYYIRKNVIDALLGSDDEDYVNRWGGELVRDNFNIGMMKQAGNNNGVIIKYSKNLIGFEQSADDSALMTRAFPTLAISVPTSATTTSTSISNTDLAAVTAADTVLKLPEKYVDSPRINDYGNIYIKEVQVTLTDAQKLLPNDQIFDLMRAFVANLYSLNIDIPIYSYVINFIELSKTEEYKDFKVLEDVNPFDLITIKTLDIDVIAELVGYTYDSLLEMYGEIILGNIQNDIIRDNQKSLFAMNQENLQNIKILQAQMSVVNDSTSATDSIVPSGGVNLFDHSILSTTNVLEWVNSGATVVTDDTLHDTNQVWELPPTSTLSKDNIILNPNNYNGRNITFSLQAKYSDITPVTFNDSLISDTLLGALGIKFKRCLAINTSNWVLNADIGNADNPIIATGIISADFIPVNVGESFEVTNINNYVFTIHGYDVEQNFVTDFTDQVPDNVFTMKIEIIQNNLTPETLLEFKVYDTVISEIDNLVEIYADSPETNWITFEQGFMLQTSNANDILTDVFFTASNNDLIGTAYIGAFMINTGTVRCDFKQSANDIKEILAIHQLAIDNATDLINAGKNGYVVINSDPDTHIQFEILIMDTPDIATAKSIWRWDSGGFGYSSTGYAGPYETAITMDGHIVAKFLSGLEIDGSLIKTGTIQSYNGNWRFNLDDETFQLGDALAFDGVTLTLGNNVILQWANLSTITQTNLKGETGDTGAAGNDGNTGPIGLTGLQGPIGTTGVAGPIGATEIASYTHIAYATDAVGGGFSSSVSTNKTYVGMYTDSTVLDSETYSKYSWSLIKGADGTQGLAGPTGLTPYFHIAYGTDAVGGGFSTTVSTGKTYIGQYTDNTSADSNNYALYLWTLIKGDTGVTGSIGPTGPTGLQGLQGVTGGQGIQGPIGLNGIPSYTHIAYSTSSTGSTGFSTTDGTGATYIGMYVDNTLTDSNTPSLYTWSLIQGANGSQGIQGPIGVTGLASYLHIAYATNSTGSTGFSTTVGTGATYIGQYTDSIAADSSTNTMYTWSLIQGPTGLTGPTGSTGLQGLQGVTGDTGLQGPIGVTGAQGIQGVIGVTGTPAYLHIAYATSSNGATGFSTTVSTGATYIGQYTDSTVADSGNYALYSWSLIQGPQGLSGGTGPQGPQGPQGIQGNNYSYITSTKITAITIESPTLTGNSVNAGIMTVGGSVNGILYVKNASNVAVVTIDNTGILVNQASYRLLEDNGAQVIMGSKDNILHDSSFETLDMNVGSWNATYFDGLTKTNMFWTIVGSPAFVEQPYGTVFGTNSMGVTSANTVWAESYSYTIKAGKTYTLSAFMTPHLFRNTVGASINYSIKVDVYDDAYDILSTYTYTGNITAGFIATTANGINNNPTIRKGGTFTAATNASYVRVTLASASTTQWVVYDGIQLVDGTYPAVYTTEKEDQLWDCITSGFPQSSWIAPTLLNGWVNFGGQYATAGYMKDSMGFVHLKGMIKSGTIAQGTTIFSLPAGYRPALVTYFIATTNPATCILYIDSSGNVVVVSGASASDTIINLLPFLSEQ